MFWYFHKNKNGLDNQGRTFNEALIDHIKWCMETLSKETKTDFDLIEKNSAIRELIDHYNQFIESLGDQDGKKWKKIITDFLEKYYQKPIKEILDNTAVPIAEGNHKWQWMPISKSTLSHK